MPLQVWLPLLGNLDNQGLDDTTFSVINNNGKLVSNVSGKLGSCYERTESGYADTIRSSKTYNLSSFTMMCWAYVSATIGDTANGIITNHNHSDNSGTGITIKQISTTDYRISCNTGNGSSRTFNAYYGTTNIKDAWHHLALTYDKSLQKLQLWVDGNVEYTLNNYANYSVANYFDLFNWSTGYANNNQYRPVCKLNDVRLYDTCLSPKEVKLISQGLVAHYQLNDSYSTNNLFPNGFGQDGALGWISSSAISTTEIPSNQPMIKASYYSGNRMTDYIPISHADTYTISEYIKAQSGVTGNVYPSILPYDVDKKFIATYNCPEGFSNTWKTTLAQPLHKGDTVVYATDISNWSTATDNYYDRVAVFGYRDSTGYLYPDMVYTADSFAFGTRTDKSNINKNNNTITLLSAYTGEDRPAGTTICQATEGNTYVYPYGGINVSTISDWTYKTATVAPSVHPRLRSARYIQYLAYAGAYHAGIQLVDNNADQIIYDSSGYNYHGDIAGTLSVSSNTPRYSVSTKFDNPNYIQYKAPANMYYATYSFWVNFDSFVAYGAIHIPKGNPTGGDTIWFSANTESTSLWAYFGGNPPHYNKVGTGNLVTNTWYHFAFTWNNGVSQWYLNGEPLGASVTYTGKTYIPNANYATIGNSYTGMSWSGTPFNGRISDFRLYATALSAADIKALYNAPVSVANNGTMITQGEFVEV